MENPILITQMHTDVVASEAKQSQNVIASSVAALLPRNDGNLDSNESCVHPNKAQVFIETTLFFVAMIFFLLMITRVWVWSNNQMAGRQPAYNDSRVEAGTAALPRRAAPLIWVVENEARGDRRVWTPGRLTRDWVFRGQ